MMYDWALGVFKSESGVDWVSSSLTYPALPFMVSEHIFGVSMIIMMTHIFQFWNDFYIVYDIFFC